MIIQKCDWCEREVDSKNSTGNLINFSWGYKSIITDRERNQIDICNECATAFLDKRKLCKVNQTQKRL